MPRHSIRRTQPTPYDRVAATTKVSVAACGRLSNWLFKPALEYCLNGASMMYEYLVRINASLDLKQGAGDQFSSESVMPGLLDCSISKDDEPSQGEIVRKIVQSLKERSTITRDQHDRWEETLKSKMVWEEAKPNRLRQQSEFTGDANMEKSLPVCLQGVGALPCKISESKEAMSTIKSQHITLSTPSEDKIQYHKSVIYNNKIELAKREEEERKGTKGEECRRMNSINSRKGNLSPTKLGLAEIYRMAGAPCVRRHIRKNVLGNKEKCPDLLKLANLFRPKEKALKRKSSVLEDDSGSSPKGFFRRIRPRKKFRLNPPECGPYNYKCGKKFISDYNVTSKTINARPRMLTTDMLNEKALISMVMAPELEEIQGIDIDLDSKHPLSHESHLDMLQISTPRNGTNFNSPHSGSYRKSALNMRDKRTLEGLVAADLPKLKTIRSNGVEMNNQAVENKFCKDSTTKAMRALQEIFRKHGANSNIGVDMNNQADVNKLSEDKPQAILELKTRSVSKDPAENFRKHRSANSNIGVDMNNQADVDKLSEDNPQAILELKTRDSKDSTEDSVTHACNPVSTIAAVQEQDRVCNFFEDKPQAKPSFKINLSDDWMDGEWAFSDGSFCTTPAASKSISVSTEDGGATEEGGADGADEERRSILSASTSIPTGSFRMVISEEDLLQGDDADASLATVKDRELKSDSLDESLSFSVPVSATVNSAFLGSTNIFMSWAAEVYQP